MTQEEIERWEEINGEDCITAGPFNFTDAEEEYFIDLLKSEDADEYETIKDDCGEIESLSDLEYADESAEYVRECFLATIEEFEINTNKFHSETAEDMLCSECWDPDCSGC